MECLKTCLCWRLGFLDYYLTWYVFLLSLHAWQWIVLHLQILLQWQCFVVVDQSCGWGNPVIKATYPKFGNEFSHLATRKGKEPMAFKPKWKGKDPMAFKPKWKGKEPMAFKPKWKGKEPMAFKPKWKGNDHNWGCRCIDVSLDYSIVYLLGHWVSYFQDDLWLGDTIWR